MNSTVPGSTFHVPGSCSEFGFYVRCARFEVRVELEPGTSTDSNARLAQALIAGNGRFPFLVLDAARALGHDVTIVAVKEEAFSELNDAAKRHSTADSLDLTRTTRHVHSSAARGRRNASRHGRTGQAHEDLRRHHSGSHVRLGVEEADLTEHRWPDRSGRGGDEAITASS